MSDDCRSVAAAPVEQAVIRTHPLSRIAPLALLILITSSQASCAWRQEPPIRSSRSAHGQLRSMEQRGARVSRNFFDDDYRYGYLVITLGPEWTAGNEGLEGLSNLHEEKVFELVLDTPEIDDAALKHLQGVRLRGLTVKESRISDVGLQSLNGLENLQSLLIDHGADITDDGLGRLKSHRLKWLQIKNGSRLTDRGLGQLAGMKDLMWLRLPGASITGRGFGNWAGINALRTLDVSHTQVDDQSLLLIARFSGLQHLDLSHTRVRGVALRHLNQLEFLWELSLDGNDLGDDELQYLSGIHSLRVLSLRGTRVTAAAAAQLRLPRLKTLLLNP
jgi:hypothetical protein